MPAQRFVGCPDTLDAAHHALALDLAASHIYTAKLPIYPYILFTLLYLPSLEGTANIVHGHITWLLRC